jgi:hypothetical protein
MFQKSVGFALKLTHYLLDLYNLRALLLLFSQVLQEDFI